MVGAALREDAVRQCPACSGLPACVPAEPASRPRLEEIRTRLRTARASRPAPERDAKVITAWNALAIRAFADAGPVLERPDYVAVARACADFVLKHLVRDQV